MTDNEIIKAMECCNSHGIDACIECPYCDKYPNCIADRNDDCIDLINRQKAEIEQLTEGNNALNGNTEKYILECERRSRKIAEDYEKEIKSEAIREFAERLKTEVKSDLYGDDVMPRGTIDWLVKEMAEQ